MCGLSNFPCSAPQGADYGTIWLTADTCLETSKRKSAGKSFNRFGEGGALHILDLFCNLQIHQTLRLRAMICSKCWGACLDYKGPSFRPRLYVRPHKRTQNNQLLGPFSSGASPLSPQLPFGLSHHRKSSSSVRSYVLSTSSSIRG